MLKRAEKTVFSELFRTFLSFLKQPCSRHSYAIVTSSGINHAGIYYIRYCHAIVMMLCLGIKCSPFRHQMQHQVNGMAS